MKYKKGRYKKVKSYFNFTQKISNLADDWTFASETKDITNPKTIRNINNDILALRKELIKFKVDTSFLATKQLVQMTSNKRILQKRLTLDKYINRLSKTKDAFLVGANMPFKLKIENIQLPYTTKLNIRYRESRFKKDIISVPAITIDIDWHDKGVYKNSLVTFL